MNKTGTSHFSLVLETPPASAEILRQHLLDKLSFETDIADVMLDLQRGQDGFIMVDVREKAGFDLVHVKGALSFPNYRKITAETTQHLPKDKVIVVYCWGHSCNSSTKAALRFAELGFQVKEMQGGIEYWRHEGGPVEGTDPECAPLYWKHS